MTPSFPDVDVDVVIKLDWPYDDALEEMRAARDRVIAGGRMTVFVGSHREEVVTLGRHAPDSQLVFRELLEQRGVLVRRVERGGGATAHGPGQLVVYPIVHLDRCGLDVVGLTCALLRAAADVSVQQSVHPAIETKAGQAGLFVDGKKLASVGFRVEHGVVTHGLALNVDNDLSLFALIAPCGVQSQAMTKLDVPLVPDLAERLGLHVVRRCVLASSRPLEGGQRPGGTGALA